MQNKPTSPVSNPLEMSDELIKLLIDKINQLYIMTRYKYLSMYLENSTNKARWGTISRNPLTDYHIKRHLNHKSTIGVFSGQALTKFISFDVDCYEKGVSRAVVSVLRDVLIEFLHVPKEHIHISFSGKKGYHLELFLSESISISIAEEFYRVAMFVVHEMTMFDGQIEFRPNYNQGVKLPLSVHHDTNEVCWFVDTETLEPIEDFNHLLTIEPMDIGLFKEKILNSLLFERYDDNFFQIEHRPAQETETLLHEVKPFHKTEEEKIVDVENILSENRLIRPGTRHISVLKVSTYLKGLGYSYEDTEKIVKSILDNTWDNYRHMIGEDTKYAYVVSEMKRVLKMVYTTNYELSKKTYRLYKQELLKILELPTKKMRLLMFSMYIHSKKYAKANGEFYMAHSVMAKMGNDSNRKRNKDVILNLESSGYLEVVKSNAISKALLKDTIGADRSKPLKIYETNVYRLTLDTDTDEDTYFTVGIEEEIDIYHAVKSLITKKEAQKKLPKNQFYTEYKPIY